MSTDSTAEDAVREDPVRTALLQSLDGVEGELSHQRRALQALARAYAATQADTITVSAEIAVWQAGGTGQIGELLASEPLAARMRRLVRDCEQQFKAAVALQQLQAETALEAGHAEAANRLEAHVQSPAFLSIRNTLSCCICHNLMVEPRVLSCGHSACAHCIAAFRLYSAQAIACPSCQQSVPSEGTPSFSLHALVNMVRDWVK
ncbi:hypothetical protein BKA62DRAFT_769086 [Auriculariales sp. MPI-PUGE-AT-0066]|nr:hypothetical protein BKA62DRAFT_769086 [Auriculariales sp. MPI-PUGE-AT-0066]